MITRAPRRRRPTATGRSCYVLELAYPPGGARLAVVFVYGRFEHIRSCLEQQFLDPALDPEVLPLAAGGTLHLWVVQRGRLVAGCDLRPHLRLDAHDGAVALDDPAFERAWTALAAAARPRWAVLLDLAPVAAWAPPLEEPRAQPGERIRVVGARGLRRPGVSYVARGAGVAVDLDYGFSDLECGEPAPPLAAFVDPDPSPR